MQDDHQKKILLESGTNEVEFLRFGMSGQLYGVNVAKVRQVIVFEPAKLCALPDLPEYILGNLNCRGECIPIVDLPKLFKMKPTEQLTPRLLLILEFNRTVIGFVVDTVDRIIRSSWKDFVPAEHQLALVKSSAVVGTLMNGEEMTPILDVEALLGELLPSASMESQLELDSSDLTKATQQLRILICEDSAVVRKVLISTLSKAGYNDIVTFGTGLHGFEYLSATPKPEVDVIISDIEMPMMDGLTLCRQVRQMNDWRSTPFFFFSSTVSPEMREKCRSVGGTEAFAKPEIIRLVDVLGKAKRP